MERKEVVLGTFYEVGVIMKFRVILLSPLLNVPPIVHDSRRSPKLPFPVIG